MKLTGKGFTMIELMVVLIILGILVAVAAPMYFSNTERARASEAVAALGMIRSALREFRAGGGAYFASANGNIQNPLPPSANPGVNATIGVTQYFAPAAYSIALAAADAQFGTTPPPQDFIIFATGAAATNVTCGGAVVANCAVRGGDVANFRLKMDNSGRTFVSYDAGTNWAAY
jgi:type IV pilus assembly protein PilA